MRCDKIT